MRWLGQPEARRSHVLGLIDSHCHLDVEAFDGDRDEVIARAQASGVVAMVVPSITRSDWDRVLGLTNACEAVFAAVGVHPHEALTWDERSVDWIREAATHPKVVAVGEIGLDYHYDFAPRELQKTVMRDQVRLAAELDLPIIVHDRDAHGDVLALLTENLNRRSGGVMHCFSGSLELAEACMALGMVISFAGPVTFKNAVNLQAVASAVPLSHLLIETDSPYLAPVPRRGKRNEPAHVVHVAEQIARLKGVAFEELARITAENTRRVFRIPG